MKKQIENYDALPTPLAPCSAPCLLNIFGSSSSTRMAFIVVSSTASQVRSDSLGGFIKMYGHLVYAVSYLGGLL